MKKGAILFAYNSPKFNYFKMAEHTAKRIHHFLNLPVTIVTDEQSIPDNVNFNFDNIVLNEPDRNNKRDWGIWINKGRYQAYEFSPYDETLLLDTDYMVNSNKLLKTFEFNTDFCCHNNTSFLMNVGATQEVLSVYSFKTLWATAVMFKKSKKAEQIFNCLKMIQNNFEHYADMHGFLAATYRNDYALTLALRIVNGHMECRENIIPWNLVHVGKNTTIYKVNNDDLNTEYVVMYDNWQRGKIRKEYCIIKDMDFHVMNKENFLELIS